MDKMTYILADGLADLSSVVPADAHVPADQTAVVTADQLLKWQLLQQINCQLLYK